MPILITLLALAELLGVAALKLAGSGKARRPHFWARVLLAGVAMPLCVGTVVSVFGPPALPLLMFAVMSVMLLPGLLYSDSGTSPGSAEGDGGGGPGRGPLPSPPDAPWGGVPLPDADQATARARDHATPRFEGRNRRRRSREPRRAQPRPIADGAGSSISRSAPQLAKRL
jgi:hypothetical protein